MSVDDTTVLQPLPGAGRVLRRARLVVTAGESKGASVLLLDRPVTLGRDPECELRLQGSGVSRRHARVDPEGDGRFALRDLGSSNGTWVDGVRVEAAPLEAGARLRIGDCELELVTDEVRLGAPGQGEEALPGVLGKSPALRAVAKLIEKAAGSELAVLLRGESGTGKERLARAVHDMGSRAGGPYEVVDCTLLTGDHLRSELFGHVKGAFTGADSDRAGAFVRADGGTLFLDEVAEIPLELQAPLLRVLEAGEVRPLGSNDVATVSVRVVAASHRDLRDEVKAGRFREDLYYRLAGILVEVPPLRDRGDDVLLLATRFLPEGVALDPEARKALAAHPWPGNVRELRNCMLRAATLCEGGRILARDLQLREELAPAPADAGTLEDVEERAIRDALAECGGNRKEAARRLGIARSTLYSKLKKLGLD